MTNFSFFVRQRNYFFFFLIKISITRRFLSLIEQGSYYRLSYFPRWKGGILYPLALQSDEPWCPSTFPGPCCEVEAGRDSPPSLHPLYLFFFLYANLIFVCFRSSFSSTCTICRYIDMTWPKCSKLS